ncbi:SUN domain-containing protein 3 isoform X2 [Pelodiscus sinensis]|uniref:SUN domain-containing protein 3 isoform X2 n=1 Tax=Pelodiscus sinensis TaxID=13735 RepID=UPI000D71EC6C|nr:SUN domain-containing protein 3 [Pelodiscus sinensis]|eukprot:XP_025033865.1 SUN domain-containing protein 3 [Pelodiscus sinensis]
MYRIPKSSGSTYLPRDETSHGTNSDSSDTENKSQDLNWLSQRQGLSPSNTERQIPISIRQEDRQLQYSPKKGIWLVFHLLALCITVLWHFVMKICSTFTRKILARKIISLALFLLSLFFFGTYYMGLLDGGGIQMSNGIYYNGFVLSDFNHFWHKDESKISGIELQSLRQASHVLKELQSLKEQIDKLQTELYTLKQGSKDITQRAVREVLERSEIKGVTTWTVKRMLNKVLEKLDEDQVQMPDYALKSAGASIIQSRTTRSYRHNGGKFFWLSFPMLVFVKSPEVILQPSNYPGDCWPFSGNQGETLIKLAMEIIPRAVTMEHISKKISPTGEISSAPKDFAVYGLKEEDEEQGTFLGQFLYNHEGDLFQTFQLKNELPEFMRYVKLKVLNNWGHPEYTCIYRFRVHGDLKNAQEFFQQSPIP